MKKTQKKQTHSHKKLININRK